MDNYGELVESYRVQYKVFTYRVIISILYINCAVKVYRATSPVKEGVGSLMRKQTDRNARERFASGR